MGNTPERLANELPARFGFKPVPIGDWIDMEFVLQEVEAEMRNELLASYIGMSANVHKEVAAGLTKMMNIISRGKQQGG